MSDLPTINRDLLPFFLFQKDYDWKVRCLRTRFEQQDMESDKKRERLKLKTKNKI